MKKSRKWMVMALAFLFAFLYLVVAGVGSDIKVGLCFSMWVFCQMFADLLEIHEAKQ